MIQAADNLPAQMRTMAADLLKAIFSRRLDLAEAVALIEGVSLPPNLALPWYRALAKAAASRHTELENWALRKARDLGCRDADFLSELQTSYAGLGNLDQADQLDAPLCRALLEDRRFLDALAPLRRLAEIQSRQPAGAFPLDAVRLGEALDQARMAGRGVEYVAIRRALRAWLAASLDLKPVSGDYNLVLIDLDSGAPAGHPLEKKVEAFTELLPTCRLALREMLGSNRDLKFLFRFSGGAFVVAGGRAARLNASPEALSLAAAAAHFVHAPFAGPAAPSIEALPGDDGEVSKRALAARESHALANLSAFVPIMAEVFGLRGFDHPEVNGSVAQIREGAEKFFKTGVNSEPGYGRFIGLFCATNGLSNDFMAFLIRLYNPPYPVPRAEGILGRLESSDLDHIADTLRRDGLYRFPNPIPADLLDDLVRFAHTGPCYAQPESGVVKEPCVYPAGNPKDIKYNFIERDLIPTRAIQRVMGDPSLLAVSQAYLGAKPVLDAVAMWWSTHVTGTPSSNAAQLYHFDMERVRWLKWFVYLTDVTTGTGPHCFVRGSHRTGRKPQELLRRGYARISDAEMAAAYPQDILELNAPKGSIFVEDTSGFHKGKVPTTGPRLVLEFEYAISLYGALFPREISIGGDLEPGLRDLSGRYPQIFCKFAFRP